METQRVPHELCGIAAWTAILAKTRRWCACMCMRHRQLGRLDTRAAGMKHNLALLPLSVCLQVGPG